MFRSFNCPNITMGTDPEVFATIGDAVFPAYKWLPSKGKAVRAQVAWTCGKVALFWDGVQAEFTVPECDCLSYVVDAVQVGIKQAAMEARKADLRARLSAKSVLEFPKDERMSAAKEHVQLGCKPSINVYGLGGEMVRNGKELPVRFSGGHIHLGLRSIAEQREKVARALDAILGVWATGVAAKLDDPIRRRYYGLPGEYRATKYGLEYRTLSNFWLLHPALMHITFEIARAVTRAALDNAIEWNTFEEDTIRAIASSDGSAARKILEQNKLFFEHLLRSRFNASQARRALDVALYGAEAVIPNIAAIEDNWHVHTDDWRSHSESEGCSWAKLAA